MTAPGGRRGAIRRRGPQDRVDQGVAAKPSELPALRAQDGALVRRWGMAVVSRMPAVQHTRRGVRYGLGIRATLSPGRHYRATSRVRNRAMSWRCCGEGRWCRAGGRHASGGRRSIEATRYASSRVLATATQLRHGPGGGGHLRTSTIACCRSVASVSATASCVVHRGEPRASSGTGRRLLAARSAAWGLRSGLVWAVQGLAATIRVMPTFSAHDGTLLSYRATGEGDPVVCLPGGPMQDSSYLGDLGGVSGHRRLVVLELRGTGRPRQRLPPLSPPSKRCAAP
jgi:hypothetical protein